MVPHFPASSLTGIRTNSLAPHLPQLLQASPCAHCQKPAPCSSLVRTSWSHRGSGLPLPPSGLHVAPSGLHAVPAQQVALVRPIKATSHHVHTGAQYPPEGPSCSLACPLTLLPWRLGSGGQPLPEVAQMVAQTAQASALEGTQALCSDTAQRQQPQTKACSFSNPQTTLTDPAHRQHAEALGASASNW